MWSLTRMLALCSRSRTFYVCTGIADRATLAVLNRNMATLPTFSQKSAGGTLTIATAGLQLQYTEGKPFAPDTLSITLLPASKDYDLDEDAPQTLTTWTYGETNEGTSNLFGTIKSLDQVGPVPLNCTENANITVHQESLHCAWGLVARSGWAILDDTDSPALDPVSGWWGVGNNTDAVDIYFFGHGLEYTAAISDYMLIGGKVAMVPRYALGIWWSRWQNIANRDTRLVVDAYAQRDLPLDVYILDMDWHSKQVRARCSHMRMLVTHYLSPFLAFRHGVATRSTILSFRTPAIRSGGFTSKASRLPVTSTIKPG